MKISRFHKLEGANTGRAMNKRQIMVLIVSILCMTCVVIHIALSSPDVISFISSLFLLCIPFALCACFPLVEGLGHELGHCIVIFLIGVIVSHKPVLPRIKPDTSKGSHILKTTSSIDATLVKYKKYSCIRWYAISGILFMISGCAIILLLCFYSAFKYIYAVIGTSISILMLEFYTFFNGRPTGDLHLFIHPEDFRAE